MERTAGLARRSLIVGIFVAALAGRGYSSFLASRPETNPNLYAPESSNTFWVSSQGKSSSVKPKGFEKKSLTPPGFESNSGEKKIDSLINTALNSNPELEAIWERTRVKAATYGMSFSRYYPRISFSSQDGYSRFMYNSIVPPGDDRLGSANAQIGLEYSISEFGRRRSEVAAARAALLSANLDFNRKIEEIIFRVKGSFYALAAAQEMVDAAKVNLEFAETDFLSVSDTMKRGLSTLPDLKFAEERRARAKLDVDDARARRAEAQAALAVAVGVPSDVNLKVGTLGEQEIPKSLGLDARTFINQALNARPDLAAEVERLKNSEAIAARAEAEFRPTLSFGGYYNETQWWLNLHHPTPLPAMGNAPVQTPYYSEAQPFYSALFTLRWDLFNGFRRHNDLSRAHAMVHSREDILKLHELQIIADVWRAYFVFDAMRQKYEDALKLWDAASESYDAYSKSYKEGLSNIVELMSAQRDFARARYTKILATADFLTASANVDYAVGVSSDAWARLAPAR